MKTPKNDNAHWFARTCGLAIREQPLQSQLADFERGAA